MAEPIANLTAAPVLISGSADEQARLVALAQTLAAACAEDVAPTVGVAMPALLTKAKSMGVSARDAMAASRLAYGLIFGMHSLVREAEAGAVPVEINRRAADGVISDDDRQAIAAITATNPAFTMLALSEADHEAAQARDYARAGQALGVSVVGSGTTAREALAVATRRQTARMVSAWGFGGEAAIVERQIVPMLTSSDATLRGRGNLLLQDLLRPNYSYRDCTSEREDSCTVRSGVRGAISSSTVKADVAMTVVEQLSQAQLQALDPGSAAALMLAIYQVPGFILRDVTGAEVGRMTDDWSFVSTGAAAMPRDGLVWQVDEAANAATGRASAAADKLTRHGPSTVSYSLFEGRLMQIRYAPKGQR